MDKHHLELASSILGFLGGSVLSLDALLAVRRTYEERGAEAAQKAANKAQGVNVDAQGNPIRSAYKLRLWFAQRSVIAARIGFLSMALGFLLDVIAKW